MRDPVHLSGHNPLLGIRDFSHGQLPPSILVGHQLGPGSALHHPGLLSQNSGEHSQQNPMTTAATSQSYMFTGNGLSSVSTVILDGN